MWKQFQLNGHFDGMETIKLLKLHFTMLSGPVNLKRNCDLAAVPRLGCEINIFFSMCYNFYKVGGLERGPLSLVITTEELLEKRSSGSGLENRD
jgi:hypothetical protein